MEHIFKSVSVRGCDTVLLQDISFFVNKGDIFGIIGFSGSGKSTLLRCLSAFTEITSGTITIQGGQNSCDRSSVGHVFQDFRLFFSKNVLDNVVYPLLISRKISKKNALKEAQNLLAAVGLEHKKNDYPSALSGGEKQKVALARALVMNPSVLVCDEITSALDTRSTEDILNILIEMNSVSGLTIVFVSHEMNVVKKICNRIMVMHQGRKIEEKFSEDLFLRPEHDLTRMLIGGVEDFKKYNDFLTKDDTEILRLGFLKENAFRPIIGELLKKIPVIVNILAGDIDLLCRSPVGFLVIALTGRESDRINFRKSLEKFHVVVSSPV
ncbi:MAG: methionine ABC transporter ATP-binding protein [Victivallaceae bacterium]